MRVGELKFSYIKSIKKGNFLIIWVFLKLPETKMEYRKINGEFYNYCWE